MDIEQEGSKPLDEELTLFQQLTHQDWKVRSQGYQRILDREIIDPESNNMLIQDYDIVFSEINPENQKLAIKVYNKLLEDGNLQIVFEKRSFWYNFVDKFLASGKAGVKDLAEDFKTVAMQKCTNLLDNCCYLLAKNNAKISKEVFKILLTSFETFDFNSKIAEVIPILDKSLLNTNFDVRTQAFDLVKKLIQTISPDLPLQLKNLKKPQLEELENLKPAEPVKKSAANGFKRRTTTTLSPDSYKSAQAVNILSSYPESWCEKVISTPKWSDKKSLVDTFLKAAEVPKLANGDYAQIFRLAKILISDSNIQVQICGLKIIGVLAKGLRQSFRPLLRSNMDILISKLKDRKNTVMDVVLETFNGVFFCLSTEELYEELSPFNSKRNKDVRIAIIKILKNYFDYIFESDNIRNLELFITLFTKLINCYYDDPDIEVRTLNNELVLYIQETLENKDELYAFNKSIDLKKVKKPQKPTLEKIQGSGEKRKKSLTPQKKKTDKPLMEVSAFDLSKNPLEIPLYSFKDLEVSSEAVEAKVNELFGYDLIKKFKDGNWKLKSDTITQITVMITNSNIRLDSYSTFCICKLLEIELKDFAESNILVIKETIQLLTALVHNCENSETIYYYIAKFVSKKAGEPRYQLINLITPVAEKLPYHIVFSLLIRLSLEKQNPKALSEINDILSSLVKKNATFVFKDLKDYFSIVLNHNNPIVRTSGLNLLKAYSPSFSDKIPIILGLIENQTFVKSIKEEIVIPKPKVSEPRQSSGLNEILSRLSSSDWKSRLSSVDEFTQYLEQNGENKLTEAFTHFQARFKDSQKAVATSAVANFRRLLENHFDHYKGLSKQIVAEMVSMITDKAVRLID